MGQGTLFGPFEIILTSQKEDEQLVERVFELKFINKNVFVCFKTLQICLIFLFFNFKNNDRLRTVRQFQVKDQSHLLIVIKRFLKEMRTYSEQNVILQCL